MRHSHDCLDTMKLKDVLVIQRERMCGTWLKHFVQHCIWIYIVVVLSLESGLKEISLVVSFVFVPPQW